MKKIVIIVGLVVLALQLPNIKKYLSPVENFSFIGDGSVVLYSTAWCGYCKKTRDYLNKHGVSFVEVDIETSAEGRREFERLGGKGVPLLSINGELVVGYDLQRVERLLKDSAFDEI